MALYGIPYQGSKGAYAPMIYRAIAQRTPADAPRVLVDPFCGGYAVSHYFGLQGWGVRASDIDRYTVALLEQVLTEGLPEEALDAWVTREEFEACRDDPDSTGRPDWWVGFVRCAWSFGNRGAGYAYGAHSEELKRLIHRLVVDRDTSPRLAALAGVPIPAQRRVAAIGDRRRRRLAWGRVAAEARCPVDPQLQSMQSAERIASIAPAGRAEPLLLDYRDALGQVPPGATVYLDPPYRATSGYVAGAFDSDELWAVATRLAERGTPVYVSEYSAPPDWVSILSFSRQNKMAADSRAKSQSRAREHLFTYGGTNG